MVNRFLTTKNHLVETGELSKRTLRDYHDVCARLVGHFGKTRLVEDLDALDFEKLRAAIAKTRGPVALGNEVQRIRIIFKYAYDAGLIEKPVRFGPAFKRPNRKTLRQARQANGQRMFEAEEIRAILDAVDNPLRAMILLGINCGFGNNDCGTLPMGALGALGALDLNGKWVNYPRPKTGSERRCPLWPETVKALGAAVASRPTPKDDAHAELVFVTKYGKAWAKETPDNPISNEMAKLLKRHRCGACGRIQEDTEAATCEHCSWKPAKGKKWPQIYRRGLNFYALRHTFETIAGESKDQVAVDYIMGHVRDDMASLYRERISDERLVAVTDHVRRWLFAVAAGESLDEVPQSAF